MLLRKMKHNLKKNPYKQNLKMKQKGLLCLLILIILS